MWRYIVVIFMIVVMSILMCACADNTELHRSMAPQLPPKVFRNFDKTVSSDLEELEPNPSAVTSEVSEEVNAVDVISEEILDSVSSEEIIPKEFPENAAFWLTIPETRMNYPVMWNNKKDSSYWLSHKPDGSESKDGSLFLDAATYGTIEGITVINGHNRSTGAMFGQLVQYKNQTFAEKHPIALIEYESGVIHKYKVFCALLMNADKEAIQILFRNDKAVRKYVDSLVSRSIITMSVDIKYDNILALSTCSYEGPNYRCVVLFTLIDE